MKKALYPGTFDPITYGHLDVINRVSRIYDDVTIAIAEETAKKTLFSLEERLDLLKKALDSLSDKNPKIAKIQIRTFKGLLVDFCSKEGFYVVIKGLRAISDFEYEFQMALTNKKLNDDVETVFMMPNESYSYLSSSLIKEVVFLRGSVAPFVPSFIEEALVKKLRSKE